MSAFPRKSHRHREHGLSLLEVLVTVTIFSMLFAVLGFGWHQSMNAQLRLTEVAERAQVHQQLAMLIRGTITEVLVPPYRAGAEFSADKRGFIAESTSSLDARVGPAPRELELRLVTKPEGMHLQVRHGDSSPRQFPWLLAQASLQYVDSKGRWHESWPPAPERAGEPLALDRDSYLPSLVVFSYRIAKEERNHTLLAAPRSSTWRQTEPTPPMAVFGLN